MQERERERERENENDASMGEKGREGRWRGGFRISNGDASRLDVQILGF